MPNTSAEIVVLVGFMGAGKTSVGRELARLLGWEFTDLDDLIEASEQRTVREIFATSGETYFREVERRELETLLAARSERLVLAVGGGAFAQPGAAETIHHHGARTILLDAPVEDLMARVQSEGTRPLAQDPQRFRHLYRERREAYATAQVKIDTSRKTIEQVAEEIAALLCSTDTEA